MVTGCDSLAMNILAAYSTSYFINIVFSSFGIRLVPDNRQINSVHKRLAGQMHEVM